MNQKLSDRDEAHIKWLMFLNADPDDTSCSKAPSEVFFDGFDAGYDVATKRHKLFEEYESQLDALHAELEEQARLNGMGSEREAKLQTECDQLKVENERQSQFIKDTEVGFMVDLLKEVYDKYGDDNPLMHRVANAIAKNKPSRSGAW